MINGAQGVYGISITATIVNTGQLPLTCSVASATPSAFGTAMPTTSINVPVGGSNSITSAVMTTTQWDNTTQTFTINENCQYTYAGATKTLTKQATMSLAIASDPTAGYSLNVTSSAGGSGGGSTGSCFTTGTTCTQGSDCCSSNCKNITTSSSYSWTVTSSDSYYASMCQCSQYNYCYVYGCGAGMYSNQTLACSNQASDGGSINPCCSPQYPCTITGFKSSTSIFQCG